MARKMLMAIGEALVKLRNDILNGNYDLFRPLYNTIF